MMPNFDTGHHVPHHELPPGVTCAYGAGRRITAEELAQIQQFQDLLRLRKETDIATAWEMVYGEPYPHERSM